VLVEWTSVVVLGEVDLDCILLERLRGELMSKESRAHERFERVDGSFVCDIARRFRDGNRFGSRVEEHMGRDEESFCEGGEGGRGEGREEKVSVKWGRKLPTSLLVFCVVVTHLLAPVLPSAKIRRSLEREGRGSCRKTATSLEKSTILRRRAAV